MHLSGMISNEKKVNYSNPNSGANQICRNDIVTIYFIFSLNIYGGRFISLEEFFIMCHRMRGRGKMAEGWQLLDFL